MEISGFQLYPCGVRKLALHLNNKLTEKTETSAIFLGSIREERTQSKMLLPTLERQTGEQRECDLPEQRFKTETVGVGKLQL